MTKAKRIDETEWEAEFERWLDPFLSTFGHEAHQKWAPTYTTGRPPTLARQAVSG